MLAGAQLGITMCSLGLGLVAEPAVAAIFEGALGEWFSLSDTWTHLIGFTLALSIVVFLHMVVGEMAPKSWAISHPESSAMKLARPVPGVRHGVPPGDLVHERDRQRGREGRRCRAAGRAGDGPLAERPPAPARRVGRPRRARGDRARAADAVARVVGSDRVGRDDGAARHHRRLGRFFGASRCVRGAPNRPESDHRVRRRPRPRRGIRPREGPAPSAERDVGDDAGRRPSPDR